MDSSDSFWKEKGVEFVVVDQHHRCAKFVFRCKLVFLRMHLLISNVRHKMRKSEYMVYNVQAGSDGRFVPASQRLLLSLRACRQVPFKDHL